MQLSTELVTGLLNYESMNEFLRLYIAYIKVSNKTDRRKVGNKGRYKMGISDKKFIG